MHRPSKACIRAFRAPDLAAVRQLIAQTIDVSYTGPYPPRAVQFFKAFHSDTKILERHRRGEILVIEQDGQVVATGTFVEGGILGVFVHPQAQHCGHGKALMRELETRARARGYDEVELSVSLPSRRFYEALGYGSFEDRAIDVGEGERLVFWNARKSLVDDDR